MTIKRFYAVNKETGEKWKPNPESHRGSHFLMMYASGSLAEIQIDYHTSVTPLDLKIWEIKYNDKSN